MGARKLSNELGIQTDEAKLLLQEYNKSVPFVRQLATDVWSHDKNGAIRTIKGRNVIDKWEPNSFGLYKAVTEEEAVKNTVEAI